MTGSKDQAPTCRRAECGKPLPDVAVKHGDPFCSAACARIEFGTLSPDEAAASAARSRAGREGAEIGWRAQHKASWERTYGKEGKHA